MNNKKILELKEKFEILDLGCSVDFDSVVWNFLKIVNNFLKKEGSEQILKYEDVTTWDFFEKNIENVHKTWEEWEYYRDSNFLDGAFDFLDTLSEIFGDKLQIVTATHPKILKQKDFFMKSKLSMNIIHCHHKSTKTKNTILIDDAPHNVLDHTENNDEHSLLFDLNGEYGWNKEPLENEFEKITRVLNYDQVFDFLINFPEFELKLDKDLNDSKDFELNL